MQKHVKIYMQHFDYGIDDFIPCENCGRKAVDIHHVIFKSHSGTNDIDNLVSLCRPCHEKAHNDYQFNNYLKQLIKKRDEGDKIL